MNNFSENNSIRMLSDRRPGLWISPYQAETDQVLQTLPLKFEDILDAESRLSRFAPLLAVTFNELGPSGGIIESDLVPAPEMQSMMADFFHVPLKGRLLVKTDHALPVAGSVKARGGMYEVLCFAERIALRHGLIGPGEPYTVLLGSRAREIFSRYTISVGSTGNLGLSIGITGSALGFSAVVHMSAEAKEWKKARLREKGVHVIEHTGDYSAAVKAGRAMAADDPCCHFVDDENSAELFLGYSVAALRLKKQLDELDMPVDEGHPLFVYIPCGVGGAPGGITFGLKHVFGDAVQCFFAEPVESPCMTLGLAAGFESGLSIYDIGLSNRTAADGLAVAKASEFAGRMIRNLVSGCFTVSDDDMFRCLSLLERSSGMRIEPSAAAGFLGPVYLNSGEEIQLYAASHGLAQSIDNAIHVVWTTGGSLVPSSEFKIFRARGEALLRS